MRREDGHAKTVRPAGRSPAGRRPAICRRVDGPPRTHVHTQGQRARTHAHEARGPDGNSDIDSDIDSGSDADKQGPHCSDSAARECTRDSQFLAKQKLFFRLQNPLCERFEGGRRVSFEIRGENALFPGFLGTSASDSNSDIDSDRDPDSNSETNRERYVESDSDGDSESD